MPPERWVELRVESPLDPEEISSVLVALGGTAVEERDGALLTYLHPPSDLDGLLGEVRSRLDSIHVRSQFRLEWRWQAHEEWEVLWRRGLGPRRITGRITVTPSWESLEVGPTEVLLVIDPGMAFGTAEHATTRGCLRVMDSLVVNGSRIADVGAGSGILSIAAARLGAREVLALEVDEMSCETARKNILFNGVQDEVRVLRREVAGSEALPGAPYDGVVANLQSHLLLPLLPALDASLQKGGWLVLSGILDGEKDLILSAASELSMGFREADREDGWWTGVFRTAAPGS
jgi:ribosomal protein L11 methyltransferase